MRRSSACILNELSLFDFEPQTGCSPAEIPPTFPGTPMQYLSTILVLLLMAAAGQAQNSRTPQETSEQHNVRMAWWREARFGMFIHWACIRSPPAGNGICHRRKSPLRSTSSTLRSSNPRGIRRACMGPPGQEGRHEYVVITSSTMTGSACLTQGVVVRHHRPHTVQARP